MMPRPAVIHSVGKGPVSPPPLPTRPHALTDVPRPYHAAVPHRVVVLHLALERDGHRLEAPVRVLADPAALAPGRAEVLGRAVVEHQPRAVLSQSRPLPAPPGVDEHVYSPELLGERQVGEDRKDMEA